MRDNQPVLNVKISANIAEQKTAIEFYDDGKHDGAPNDGAPNDSIYGAITERLLPGDYAVEAKAECGSWNAAAFANLLIGSPINSSGKAVTPIKRQVPRRKNYLFEI